jgi:hypothetical protein
VAEVQPQAGEGKGNKKGAGKAGRVVTPGSDWLHGPYRLSSIGVLNSKISGEKCQP